MRILNSRREAHIGNIDRSLANIAIRNLFNPAHQALDFQLEIAESKTGATADTPKLHPSRLACRNRAIPNPRSETTRERISGRRGRRVETAKGRFARAGALNRRRRARLPTQTAPRARGGLVQPTRNGYRRMPGPRPLPPCRFFSPAAGVRASDFGRYGYARSPISRREGRSFRRLRESRRLARAPDRCPGGLLRLTS